jgi:hypothetical protein
MALTPLILQRVIPLVDRRRKADSELSDFHQLFTDSHYENNPLLAGIPAIY